ncbi:MAG: hypothetical protein H8E44_07355 [Planctomycetes bacterium]|nr:hypothetical protein [Planctomycetota bacterium]MBL7044738.1 hypothetical protein [Pirellulaceae bacterium]
MLGRVGRTSLKLLVAVAVLAWTTVPPAIVHSHSDGNNPAHRHEARTPHHDHQHSHDPLDAADHAHVKTAALDCVESKTLAAHCHWQLLGFWLALPISGEQGDREDERDMAKVAIVDLADDDGLALSTGSELAQAVCQPSPTAIAGFVPLVSSPQDSQRQTSSTPLCDSARLERSGVLLA